METTSNGSFKELGLSSEILEALRTVGYESPSPIQLLTIPLILAGKDVFGQAQTRDRKNGSIRTASFV